MVLSVEEASESQSFAALTENQYYIEIGCYFSEVMAWMHREKENAMKMLDLLFHDEAVLIYQMNPDCRGSFDRIV